MNRELTNLQKSVYQAFKAFDKGYGFNTSTYHIARKAGIQRDRCRGVLSRLADKGLVVKTSSYLWQLPKEQEA